MSADRKSDESLVILMEGATLSIPFNILLGLLLSFYMLYKQAPFVLVSAWFFSISIVSVLRIIQSKIALKKRWHVKAEIPTFLLFVFLVFITASIWSSAYFIFLPYIKNTISEAVVIIFLGGMSVGAMTSLSVRVSAFYAFIVPIFLPVMLYNFYLFNVDRFVMALMFLFFMIGTSVFANISASLWKKVFSLSLEKDKLIHKLKDLNADLGHAVEDLEKISITDALTSLYNRRHFDDIFPYEFNRAKRNQYPLNLVFIDIDNFKLLNDNYGHPYGDRFLVNLAALLKDSVKRANDTVFRLGGDEFAIIMANSDLEEAKTMLHAILLDYKDHGFPNGTLTVDEAIKKQVTLSVGLINIHPQSNINYESAVIAADKILYQAKHAGKNQIQSQQF